MEVHMGNGGEPGQSNQEKLEAHLREARSKSIPDLLESMTIMREELKLIAARVEGLETRLNTKKLEQAPGKVRYVLALILVILITALLVWRGWAQKPDVSIEFNVGEIVGGVGVLVAGLVYAFGHRRGEG
jgi:hypothetical protein